jgi:hypothetical protein
MVKIGSILFVLFLEANALASGLVSRPIVVVSPNPVPESQSVQLKIEVETELSTVVYQPTFQAPDFIMIGSGPQVYGNPPVTKYISGKQKTVTKRIFEFVLSPKKAGVLWIRNIQLKVGGDTVKSEDMMVKVLEDSIASPTPTREDEEEDSSNPASPNYNGSRSSQASSSLKDDEPSRFNSDFTVHAAISKKKVFPGEPIIIEYWLYDFGGLREVEVQKWPTFNGFWKEDLEITNRFEFEEIFVDNRIGRRAFISRYALYGLRPGKFRLDRLVIRGAYVAGIVSNGFFQSQSMRVGTHGSQELEIEVQPLPKENQPKDFTGAVGSFQLKLESEKTIVPQHTPVTLTLTLSGEGNFQSIDNIIIPLPEGFESYDSKTGAKGTTPIGMRRELFSQKVFQITAIPRKSGKFTIPAIEWNYFHPEKNAYEKISTLPLELEVSENAAGAGNKNVYSNTAPGSDNSTEKLSLLELNSQIGSKISWFRFWNILLILFGIVNAVLLFQWIKQRSKGMVIDLLADRLASAKTEFQAGKNSGKEDWLNHFEECLYGIGEVLLESNPRGITRSDFESHWREKKLPPTLFHQIALTLDQLDQLRFAGKRSQQELNTTKKKMESVINGILKEAVKLL